MENINFIEGIDIEIKGKEFSFFDLIKISKDSDKISFKNCIFDKIKEGIESDAKRLYFEECSFRGLEKIITGNTFCVFNNCKFELEGNILTSLKDMWERDEEDRNLCGAVFLACKISSKTEKELYISETGAFAVMIECELPTEDKTQVIWSKKMLDTVNYYYYNNNVHIYGSDECAQKLSEQSRKAYNIWNLLSGEDEWDPSGVRDEYIDYKKEIFFVKLTRNISCIGGMEKSVISLSGYPLTVQNNVMICEEGGIKIIPKASDILRNEKIFYVIGENDSEESVYKVLRVTSENGLIAECLVEVLPSMIEPPKFINTPIVDIRDGRAYIEYKFDTSDKKDMSDIRWYRVDNKDRSYFNEVNFALKSNEKDCRKIAVSQDDSPCYNIQLTYADVGKRLKVNVKPRHNRSKYGASLNVESRIIRSADIKAENISIVFENSVLETTYDIEPGYLTAKGSWEYKKLEGVKSKGLVASDNICGLYYQSDRKVSDIKLLAMLSIGKNIPSGFADVGDYEEIYIKYDAFSNSGYGIRYELEDKETNQISFRLFKYEDNIINPISDSFYGNFFSGDIDIEMEIIDNVFKVTISYLKDYKTRYETLYALVVPNKYGGVGIKHASSEKVSGISIKYIEFNYV